MLRFYSRIASNNKSAFVLFTVSRYFIYVLQFGKGLLIAGILGPAAFGLWGFLALVSQYLSYSKLGSEHAVTLFLSTEEHSGAPKIIARALLISSFSLVFLFALGLTVHYIDIPVFQKYDLQSYVVLLAVVGLQNIRSVLTNAYRVYRSLYRITTVEFLDVLLPLGAIFLFPAEQLVDALLVTMVVSGFLGILIYVLRSPFPIFTKVEPSSLIPFVWAGIPLLVNTVAIYLVTDVGKMVVAALYPVQTMGYYSFASSITNGVLLGLGAVTWVIFPTVLSKVHLGINDDVAVRTIHKVTSLYRTALAVLILSAILVSPVLFLFFSSYRAIETTLAILLLSQLVYGIAFGFSSVSAARKRYFQAAGLSILSASVSAVLCLTAGLLQLDVIWIAFSVLTGLALQTILQVRLGRSLFSIQSDVSREWASIFSPGVISATILIVVGSLAGYLVTGAIFGIVAFIVLDRRHLIDLFVYIRGAG
jgi:hypothetical protein